MKTTFSIIMIFLSLTLFSQTENSVINVSINNVPNNEGTVQFALYNKETFRIAPPLQIAKSKIEGGKAIATFRNLEKGSYAILCYHDSNGNGKMDFELNGMPKELYGSSGNEMTMGPPQWEDCKFNFEGPHLDIEIRL